MTEQALRAAEIDVCRHKLEMIRASEAEIEARAERRRLRWLELEAQQARELERGVPRTLRGVHPPVPTAVAGSAPTRERAEPVSGPGECLPLRCQEACWSCQESTCKRT